MLAEGQPATIPGAFLERVDRWARAQADPVSVILFGSRARGDHGPKSDWDFALVFEGDRPSLAGLPHELGGAPVEWVPMERSRALSRLNISSLTRAVAASGRCLHGDPLPKPERNDMDISGAWDTLLVVHDKMHVCLYHLTAYWRRPAHWRSGYSAIAAPDSAMAAELLCKAVLSMRGVEPKRSHSVSELCSLLEDAFPADPLLPLLRDCDGITAEAHVSMYTDRTAPRESVSVSADRVASVLRAAGEVLAAVCEASDVDEGGPSLQELIGRVDELSDALARLQSTSCPPDTLRRISSSLGAGPTASELWDLLTAPPPGRAPESAGHHPGR